MPRGRSKSVSDDEIMAQFAETKAPVTTAAEISDRIGMSRQGAHNRLQNLHEDGRLCKQKLGKRLVVWWPTIED
ncbi:MAG: helix-turn-helix domain-containing protein [Halorientalis sp.]